MIGAAPREGKTCVLLRAGEIAPQVFIPLSGEGFAK